jgi:hypothetical protein
MNAHCRTKEGFSLQPVVNEKELDEDIANSGS